MRKGDHLPDRTPLDYLDIGNPRQRLRDTEAALRATYALGLLGSILAFGAGMLVGWMV